MVLLWSNGSVSLEYSYSIQAGLLPSLSTCVVHTYVCTNPQILTYLSLTGCRKMHLLGSSCAHSFAERTSLPPVQHLAVPLLEISPHAQCNQWLLQRHKSVTYPMGTFNMLWLMLNQTMVQPEGVNAHATWDNLVMTIKSIQLSLSQTQPNGDGEECKAEHSIALYRYIQLS